MEAYARRLEAKMKTIDDLNHQLGRGGAGNGGSFDEDRSGLSRGTGATRSMTTLDPNSALNHHHPAAANRPHYATRTSAAMPQPRPLAHNEANYSTQASDGGADSRRGGVGPAGGLNPAAGAKDSETDNQPMRPPPHAMSIGDKIAEIERYEDFLKSESQNPPPKAPPLSGAFAGDRKNSSSGHSGENVVPVEDLGALQNQIEQMWNDDDDDDDDAGNTAGAGEIGDYEYGRQGGRTASNNVPVGFPCLFVPACPALCPATIMLSVVEQPTHIHKTRA